MADQPVPDDRALDEDPLGDEVRSAVLEDEEGEPYTVDQQNLGALDEAEGDGEWPHPASPPEAPAPGS